MRKLSIALFLIFLFNSNTVITNTTEVTDIESASIISQAKKPKKIKVVLKTIECLKAPNVNKGGDKNKAALKGIFSVKIGNRKSTEKYLWHKNEMNNYQQIPIGGRYTVNKTEYFTVNPTAKAIHLEANSDLLLIYTHKFSGDHYKILDDFKKKKGRSIIYFRQLKGIPITRTLIHSSTKSSFKFTFSIQVLEWQNIKKPKTPKKPKKPKKTEARPNPPTQSPFDFTKFKVNLLRVQVNDDDEKDKDTEIYGTIGIRAYMYNYRANKYVEFKNADKRPPRTWSKNRKNAVETGDHPYFSYYSAPIKGSRTFHFQKSDILNRNPRIKFNVQAHLTEKDFTPVTDDKFKWAQRNIEIKNLKLNQVYSFHLSEKGGKGYMKVYFNIVGLK